MKKIILLVSLLTLPAIAEEWALKTVKDSDPLLKPQKESLKLDHEVVVSGAVGNLHIGRSTAFEVTGGYHLFIRPELQIGVDASMQLATGSSSFSLLIGPTLNLPFDRDFRDAFFFGGGLGFSTTSGTGATVNKFLFKVVAGKRFHLYQNIMYRPTIGIVEDPQHGTGFEIRFLAISAAF